MNDLIPLKFLEHLTGRTHKSSLGKPSNFLEFEYDES